MMFPCKCGCGRMVKARGKEFKKRKQYATFQCRVKYNTEHKDEIFQRRSEAQVKAKKPRIFLTQTKMQSTPDIFQIHPILDKVIYGR